PATLQLGGSPVGGHPEVNVNFLMLVPVPPDPFVVTQTVNDGPTNVIIRFSKPVENASATNGANYVFAANGTVLSATLAADNETVTLTTTPLLYGTNYAIIINQVRDRMNLPNAIAPDTRAEFPALPFTLQDLGNPPGTVAGISTDGGVNLTAPGGSFGGTNDQGGFASQSYSGNFDVAVRLAGLDLTDIFAQAGLMARDNLNPGARFVAAFATPAMNGSGFEWRSIVGGPTQQTGNFPANYPQTWLRLRRVGNVFTGYAGYDGEVWTMLGSNVINLPTQLYVGLAVSSHSSGVPATAAFRDFMNVTNAVVTAPANPHEPPGASSRKTPLIFSEIMYKPAARTDGANTEFIELYNSNPWFQDLSGCQIVCADLQYTFPPHTQIAGGGVIVVAAAPEAIRSVYGLTNNVYGPYTGSLKKSEELQLRDEQGAVLLTVPYTATAPWPVAASGTGHSIVLTHPSYGEGDPRAWERSELAGGSPGQLEAWYPSPLHQVVINEWLVPTNSGTPGFVELYNHSATPVDVSGCVLTADSTTNQFGLPPGTAIPAGGFVSFDTAELGFEPAITGDTLMLESADQTRIFDAVALGPQQRGVVMGRAPDGAGEFCRLQTATPGSANDVIRVSDVVINELMYDPISHNDDDQYVELYNRSTNVVDLSGWQLAGGVAYTMPAGTSLAPDAYLVVARNRTNLFGKYPQLNAGNTVGDFSGKLAHKGEYLALTMPVPEVTTNGAVLVTNTLHVVVNDFTYGTGGRWGEWSAGGGSSLELINPRANGRLAASWADSDETQKADWTNIEFTGVLDLGQNYESGIARAQLGLLDEGECLVDDVEVDSGSDNLAVNPSFESGATGWSFQGCLSRSSVEAGGYNNDGHTLHVRASDTIWTGDNSCQVTLSNTNLQAGQTVTLRFKARWLCGWPEALLRLNGNWLEAAGSLSVPGNLGTPGLPNSRYVTHSGVALSEVTHAPALPAANQPVVITARAYDPEGSPNLKLFYRLDPATSQVILPMHDDGQGGDAVAGDGIYSVTIPGMNAGQLVAFHIDATDNFSTVTRFPALVADHAPLRECLVLFGDDHADGSFSVYHLWVSNTNATRWANLGNLSNESHDGTMVYGNRVIYNMQGRFAGSPYHQNYGRPDAQLCNYKWTFPADDKFLGATSFNKIHQPGNGAGDDGSLQREQLANTFLRALGVPWLNRRYVAVYVNGNRRGTLMEDAQTPGSDVVAEHFPDDADGWLYKMQPWFEFAPALSGTSMDFNNVSWATLNNYTTAGGVKKTARYRYQYLIRTFPGSASDFHKVYELVDAASTYNTPGFASNLTAVADMENWMRVFAANHAAGNWDSFGAQNAQNLYGYAGALGTKYSLLMFDFNIVIGNQNSSWGPGENLFAVNSADPALQTVFNTPVFRRMYWRALGELVNGPLNPATSGPLLDAKYQVFAANGFSVEDPNTAIKSWLTQARTSIAAQLAAENTLTFAVNPATLSNTMAVLSGTAPVAAQVIQINGQAAPVTWTGVTKWTVTLPLQHGTNVFTVLGLDRFGNLIPGEIGGTSLYYAGAGETPSGPPVVFINEWMADNGTTLADPAGSGFADWFELYNPGTNAVDLGGCFLTDKLTDKFQFQVPTNGQYQLPPRGFLLVWADNQAEQNLPGQPDLHVNFALSKGGEAIGLFAPDGTAIDTVTFGAQTTDVSLGRIPDGAAFISALTVPTPGTNNFSRLPVGLTADSGGAAPPVLRWQTVAGQNYQVEYTDDLALPHWLPLGNPIVGTGGVVTVTNVVAGPAQRFFRIQIR
ncbi:MAG TPA: lamin tail domain-containing protein, partial [Dongiaceae bacterium]|nr:lamin tail domain-containing protein [Dongiaceae bacterium]